MALLGKEAELLSGQEGNLDIAGDPRNANVKVGSKDTKSLSVANAESKEGTSRQNRAKLPTSFFYHYCLKKMAEGKFQETIKNRANPQIGSNKKYAVF